MTHGPTILTNAFILLQHSEFPEENWVVDNRKRDPRLPGKDLYDPDKPLSTENQEYGFAREAENRLFARGVVKMHSYSLLSAKDSDDEFKNGKRGPSDLEWDASYSGGLGFKIKSAVEEDFRRPPASRKYWLLVTRDRADHCFIKNLLDKHMIFPPHVTPMKFHHYKKRLG